MSDPVDFITASLHPRYRLERELGRGGMAVVYLALDLKHRRPVALKVIDPDRTSALSVRPRRFRREIELAARLQHPHVLGVYDSGEIASPDAAAGAPLLWFTMPYVRGGSLRDRLRREGPIPVDEALRITRETAQALAYAHAEGVIHRDIKPENILLTEDGMVLVADFGIARAVESTGPGDDESLTRTGHVLGTPAYMAPEQATHEHPVDGRADQYALAAVCYEMLTGEPPFSGPTAGAVIVARHTSPTPSALTRRPELPAGMDEALQRALALDPGERFGSVREFAQALTGVRLTPEGADGRAGAPAHPRTDARADKGLRVRPGVMAATLVLGVLIGVGILFAWRRAQTASETAAATSEVEAAGPPRIAVLPFESRGDSSVALLAEGVSDAVRGKLARLSEVRVIARASSVPYRQAGDPPEEIARALGVSYLLTGVVRVGPGPDGTRRVQVSPELVEVSGDEPTVRWQAPFDAPLGDVFQLESRIAGDVVSALSLALGEEGYRALAEQPTRSAEAWAAFQKGEIANEQRDAASVRRAVGFFRQAVTLDSSFGLGWARLARLHSVLYSISRPDPEQARLAGEALARAERLLPDHPAMYHARALYQLLVKNDPPVALATLDSGLAHWPQDVDLLGTGGAVDRRPERTELALARLRRAQELDPRSVNTAVRFSFRLLQERRYDEARQVADRGLELAPTNLLLVQTRVMAELGKGDAAAARAAVARAAATPGIDPAALAVNLAGAEDTHWVLDSAQQRLVLDLPPAAFDNSRSAWALVRTRIHWYHGDTALARAWADTAARELAAETREAPEDPRPRVLRGVALGFQGDSAGAVREGEAGIARIKDFESGIESAYLLRQMALAYLLAGDREKAGTTLDRLLAIKQQYSAEWLGVDPEFAGVRQPP
jgi:TolB-like protein